MKKCFQIYIQRDFLTKTFTAWIQNRLVSAGLEPVLRHAEKASLVTHFGQFSADNNMENYKNYQCFVGLDSREAEINKHPQI